MSSNTVSPLKLYISWSLPAIVVLAIVTFVLEFAYGYRVGAPWALACTLVQAFSVLIPVYYANPNKTLDPTKVFMVSLVIRMVVLPIFLAIPLAFEQVELIFFLISVAVGYIILQLIEIRWLFVQIGNMR